MTRVAWLSAMLVLASPRLVLGAEAASEIPPSETPPSHDPAHPSIDCPLHQRGVSPSSLRPFSETEKYIRFLERADRAAWQKPDDVVRALRLSGAETVADVGAGSGYFTFRLAKALPRGRVIASDVDPEMVRHVHHKVLSEHITNVQAVLEVPQDPGIDPAADVVFVCDVIHHVEGREAWLRRLSAEMKPGSKLVVIEFKEGKLPEGPPEAVKVSKRKLVAMVTAAGLTLRSDDPKLLPFQTFLVFEKVGGVDR